MEVMKGRLRRSTGRTERHESGLEARERAEHERGNRTH